VVQQGLTKLLTSADIAEDPLEDDYLYGLNNLTLYDGRKAPAGYPSWPYNKFKISSESVIESIQTQLDSISNAFSQQREEKYA